MPLEWAHDRCGEPGCNGATDCPGFPSTTDRINMAKAAYKEYAESDGTPIIDFALDVLLFAQSQHPQDKTLLQKLTIQALREWMAHTGWRAERQYTCTLCGDRVPTSGLRDHLAGHSTAAESAINDPSEFFEKVEDPDPVL